MRIMLDTNILVSAFIFKSTIINKLNDVEEKLFEIRDEDDYIILHTAILENVDIFITGDKDFKEVDIEKPEIMTIREFLQKY